MSILFAILLFGFLIFIHELGHFILAKINGVKVLRFSLGFGPKVISRKIGDTEYMLSAVPLGGYVKMLGEDVEEEEQGKSEPYDEARSYKNQSALKKASIVFSGPLFNLLTAVVIFFFIYLTGVPVPYPDIGKIEENSPASRAGLMSGDRVVAVNGTPVNSWDEIIPRIEESEGTTLTITVKRNSGAADLAVQPEKKLDKNIFGEDTEHWDIGISPYLPPRVGDVLKGSRAEKAGLLKDDVITAVDRTPVRTWQDVTDIIHGNPGKKLVLTVSRGSRKVDVAVTPEGKLMKLADGKEKKVGLIGIRPAPHEYTKRYGVMQALPLSIKKTWDVSVLTLMGIVKLIQRIVPAETIGGPILIFQLAEKQATAGAMNYFLFAAVISINLGILNLLPIPVLDGGHLLFLGIEAVRGKPLSEKSILMAQRIGLAIIIMLMVFAMYNDIIRLIRGMPLP